MSARRPRGAAAALLVIAAAGCATGGPRGGATATTPVDSATVALWRLDETAGPRAADAGPRALHGSAGVDTRSDFGRIRNGRLFTRSIDSFVIVEAHPALDPYRELTIEAWVRPAAWGAYELSPLVHRWNQQPGEQSWLLALTGFNVAPAFQALPGPGFFTRLVQRATPGYVVFGFVPEGTGIAVSFSSATSLPLDRWTHVAASYDGEVVRIFLDGLLDAQYAAAGRVRGSRAPLMIGNYFDWRALSAFGGDLRYEGNDRTPWYAFEGVIDEVRLSSAARTDFPHLRE